MRTGEAGRSGKGTMSSLCSSSPVEKPAVVQRPTRVRVQSTLLPSEQQRLDSYNKHEVQDGDSIQKLAIKYRVSVSPGRRTLIQTTWPSYANSPRVATPGRGDQGGEQDDCRRCHRIQGALDSEAA